MILSDKLSNHNRGRFPPNTIFFSNEAKSKSYQMSSFRFAAKLTGMYRNFS